MTQEQINYKEMFDAVIAFMDSTNDRWSSIPKIAEVKVNLTNLSTQIDEKSQDQLAAKVYVGKNKTRLKHTVAVKADILNDTVEAFADFSGDVALASKMSKSQSELYTLRNEDFAPAIKEVLDETEKHKDVLIPEYGVSEEQVTDLKNDIDGYLTLLGQPRAYKIASSQATKDLETLFEETNDLLNNRLDKLMKIFKRRDANLYNGYLAARVIVDA